MRASILERFIRLGTPLTVRVALLHLGLVQDHAGTRKSRSSSVNRCGMRGSLLPIRHFTPPSPSWIDLVECWFSVLSARQSKRGRYRSIRALENVTRHCVTVHNDQPKPFIWTRAADEILQAVAEFCARISDAHH